MKIQTDLKFADSPLEYPEIKQQHTVEVTLVLTRLVEVSTQQTHEERRCTARFQRFSGLFLSEVASANGTTVPATVHDLSPRGIRLTGGFNLVPGERFDLKINMGGADALYRLSAVVVHAEDHSIGARFVP